MIGGMYVENPFELPKADYFTVNDNVYTGSQGPFNYRLDATGDTIDCTVWLGPLCMAKSKIAATAAFSKDEEGYDKALRWLDGQRGLGQPSACSAASAQQNDVDSAKELHYDGKSETAQTV